MSWLPLSLYRWRRGLTAKSDMLNGAQDINDSRRDEEQISFKLGQRAPSSNWVHTNNYTLFNFLPKFLFAQFKQIANLYFLVLGVIQMLPGLSPFGKQATLVPLSFIIGCSAVREIYEDLQRRFRDRKMNYQKCCAHTDEGWKTVPWCEVGYLARDLLGHVLNALHVGQMIRVVNGEQLAADTLLLATSESGSVAYVETANLDGESNLKEFWHSGIEIYYDAPNRNIYEFQGYMSGNSLLLQQATESTSYTTEQQNATKTVPVNQPFTIPLSNAHVILRGARLKNTDNIYGIVLYTGHNTKLFKNSIKRVMKSSLLASLTNSIMLTLFGVVLLLCLTHATLTRVAQPIPFLVTQFSNHYDESLVSIFLHCLVLFSGFIPISLYVTLEMIQIVQGMFIHHDESMIDESQRSPDVKMFSLNSELGNVKYVMSDKTGTLTQNNMRFRMCSVGGVKYANRKARREKVFSPKKLISHIASNEMKNAEKIREFLIACAICHTASPDKNTASNERPLYHATSPDEHALLTFASDAGFIFQKRSSGKIIVNMLGAKLEYELAAILEFDSDRKRMSVIVKEPSGNYKLYIKGADYKIFYRLKDVSRKELKRTSGHLQQFAVEGYRTLCFAMRTIDEDIFVKWYNRYNETITDMTGRREKLAELAEEIEKDLNLIGVSAIEDRLQKDVPQTVARLISAGIRVWVLTGDKLETAVNIGNSCQLLSGRGPMMVLSSTDATGAKQELEKYLKMLGKEGLARRDQDLSLVVDATCLDYILVDEKDRDRFLCLALCCSAVICCRCTPIQKAAVTRLVKSNVNGAVLAIGDGANDVAMLQEADVGVGIAGQEGMQAALASDYTITQFHHLDRLLFVHGTLSLFRTSKCILFSLYKNVLETCVLSSFAHFNGRSVQTVADEWTVLCYNMFFTSFPALVMGVIDRPAPISSLIKYPQVYQYYQNSLSNRGLFRWCASAVLQSMVIFWVNIYNWDVGAPLEAGHGQDSSLWVFGVVIYSCLVLVANLKALLETSSITSISLGIGVLSVFLFLLSLVFYTFFSIYIPLFSPAVHGMLFMMPLTTLLLVAILATFASMVPDMALKAFRRTLRADLQDAMLWREGFRGPNFNILYQPIFKMCDIVGLKTFEEVESNKYGFAFSQDDGLAVMQVDLLQKYSDEPQSGTTTAVEETYREMKVKMLDRSVDDKTVESTSMKSPPQNTATPNEKTKLVPILEN